MSQTSGTRGAGLALAFPPELVDAIACRVVALLDERAPAVASPWLDVEQAATYIVASRQRVYDLVHAGTLRPARDGRRLLFRREWLDELLLSPTSDSQEPEEDRQPA